MLSLRCIKMSSLVERLLRIIFWLCEIASVDSYDVKFTRTPYLVQFQRQVNQDVVMQILILQRQSKLDDVTERTGEADGLGDIPATQPPLTTPLERRDIPPQLIMTLEHILGQLDVLTQVSCGKFLNRELFQKPRALGVGMGMGNALLLVTPSRCHSWGRIPVMWKHYSCSLSLPSLPLGEGILDCKMGLIPETAVGYQFHGPCWEKGHEQSNLRFLFCRDEAKISCNMKMYQLMLKRKIFFSVRERLLYSLRHFLSQTVSILEQMLTMTENKLREYLDNQQKITLQIRPNEQRNTASVSGDLIIRHVQNSFKTSLCMVIL